LARANYLQISLYPVNPREGTSPGLIASFVMAFPLLLAIPMVGIYCAFIARMIDRLAEAMPARLSLFGHILLLYFLYVLFVSPVDFLLIVDNAFIMLALLAIMAFGLRRGATHG
jgi:hypothetical protein